MSEYNYNAQKDLQQLIQNTNDIKSKLSVTSGYLLAMRLDNNNEQKINTKNSEQILALIKTTKRTIDIYLIITVALFYIFFLKTLLSLFF